VTNVLTLSAAKSKKIIIVTKAKVIEDEILLVNSIAYVPMYELRATKTRLTIINIKAIFPPAFIRYTEKLRVIRMRATQMPSNIRPKYAYWSKVYGRIARKLIIDKVTRRYFDLRTQRRTLDPEKLFDTVTALKDKKQKRSPACLKNSFPIVSYACLNPLHPRSDATSLNFSAG
jgi:predicted ABC-class ATPase